MEEWNETVEKWQELMEKGQYILLLSLIHI